MLTEILQGLWSAFGLGSGMSGETASPEGSVPREPQMTALKDFLQRRPLTVNGFYSQAYVSNDYGYGKRFVLSGGGYELLFRSEKADEQDAVCILNLDKPIMPVPVETWRARASVAARDLGMDVLPVSHTAFTRVGTGAPWPRLIHREGFEAVFAIATDSEVKYYLSAYDDQEDPPLYFLCRLPHAVATVAEAREALKPPSVKAALDAGTPVCRQGDLFFISTGLEDDADIRLATRDMVLGGGGNPKRRLLYGTAHYADNIARLPNGVMLAKGTVRHSPRLADPSRSVTPDHHALVLDPGWWIVARNTVPATPRPAREPVARARSHPPLGQPWVIFNESLIETDFTEAIRRAQESMLAGFFMPSGVMGETGEEG